MFLHLFAFFKAEAKPVGILLISAAIVGPVGEGGEKTTKDERSLLAAYNVGGVETEFRPADVVST